MKTITVDIMLCPVGRYISHYWYYKTGSYVQKLLQTSIKYLWTK